MKRSTKKLSLSRETLRWLDLGAARGGNVAPTRTEIPPCVFLTNTCQTCENCPPCTWVDSTCIVEVNTIVPCV